MGLSGELKHGEGHENQSTLELPHCNIPSLPEPGGSPVFFAVWKSLYHNPQRHNPVMQLL
jgi:hypothetical protein